MARSATARLMGWPPVCIRQQVGAAKAYRGLLPILGVCAVALAGCGGNESSSTSYTPPQVGRSAPPVGAFPDPSGKTLRELLKSTDAPLSKAGLLMESTAMVFYKGRNRYPIQITTKSKAPVQNVDVALYLAKVPPPRPAKHHTGKAPVAQAQTKALDSPAQGPFPAHMDTLATEPQFTANSTAEDPRSATVVYVDSLDFPANGEWRVGAVVRDGNETFSALLPNVVVGEFRHVPRIGQRAPLIHTPTEASVGGDLEAISTRQPPSTMNKVDFASVLGREPVLLVFASPKFSWNRTAGPTLDVAEQVAEQFRGQVSFINVEVYNGNDPGNGVRPQVRAYHLPSEPWLFAIDRQGRIVGEIEGAVSVSELTRLIKQTIRD